MSSSKGEMLAGARDLIAQSAAFRARCNVATPAEALARIHYGQVAIEQLHDPMATLAAQRPLAILAVIDHGYRQYGVGDAMLLGAYGSVYCQFQDNPKPGASFLEARFDFEDFLGSVIDEIAEVVGQDQPDPGEPYTYFPFREICQAVAAQRSDVAEGASDDFQWASYIFRHGVDA